MIVNDTLKIIKQRRSIRSFKTEQIKEEELQAVLEAGLYAPYACEDGKHFTVIQNKEILDRLNYIAKKVAQKMNLGQLSELGVNENFNCLHGAPTLIVVSGNENTSIPCNADCAAATQNLLLAAEAIGLGSCWIHFILFAFIPPHGLKLLKELEIPDDYKPYYSAVIGYKKETEVNIPDRESNLITYIK